MPVVDWTYALSPMLGEYIEIHGWPPFPTLEEEEDTEEEEDKDEQHYNNSD